MSDISALNKYYHLKSSWNAVFFIVLNIILTLHTVNSYHVIFYIIFILTTYEFPLRAGTSSVY